MVNSPTVPHAKIPRAPQGRAVYIKLLLQFADAAASNFTLTEASATSIINKALTNLFGVIGGAVPWELEHVEGSAVGNIPSSSWLVVKASSKDDCHKLTSAAALLGDVDGNVCRLMVLETSKDLDSLLQRPQPVGSGAGDMDTS